jgi:hypothetical protein
MPPTHDLPVRLESDRLRKACVDATEREGGGNTIRVTCFGKARYQDLRVLSIIRDDASTRARANLGDQKVAVRLEEDRGTATRRVLGRSYQFARLTLACRTPVELNSAGAPPPKAR